MADDAEFTGFEHARRDIPRFPTAGLGWLGNRKVKPLLGGFVATGIVVAFLAIRGGDAEVFNDITGQKVGGWTRHADVHLLIVINAAIVVGLAVQFLGEYTRHWTELWLALLGAGTFLAIREATDLGAAADNILLGLVIASFAVGFAVMLGDAALTRNRASY